MQKKINWQKAILASWKPYFWIAVIIITLYARAVLFDFTYLDDNTLILDNFYFISELSNIPKAFTYDVFLSTTDAYYRPLLTVSLIVDAQLSGQSPFFYHISNILFHTAAALVLYKLLLALKVSKYTSFTSTLIFAVHPTLTQAVAWIPGRNDSLLTIFFLGSFYFFLKMLKTPAIKYTGLHILLFFLAILTKESAIAIPIICLTYLILFKNKYNNKINTAISVIFGWVIVIFLWYICRQNAFIHPIQFTFFDTFKSILNNSEAIVLYLGKALFPANLSVLPTLTDSSLVFGYISSVALLVFSFYLIIIRKNKLALFGLLWFFILIIFSIIRPNQEVSPDFLDHRLYLPIIGLIILLAPFIEKVKSHKSTSIVILPILIMFIIMNLSHQDVFQTSLKFWENAQHHSPHSPLANRNLGVMYYFAEDFDSAEKLFNNSLSLNPTEQMAYNNLGLIKMRSGQLQLAEEYFNKEIQINPYYATAYYNLGLLYQRQDKLQSAAENWLKVLSLNPNYSQIQLELAEVYAQLEQYETSAQYYLQAQKRGLQNKALEDIISQGLEKQE